jgi:hypothetical protein
MTAKLVQSLKENTLSRREVIQLWELYEYVQQARPNVYSILDRIRAASDLTRVLWLVNDADNPLLNLTAGIDANPKLRRLGFGALDQSATRVLAGDEIVSELVSDFLVYSNIAVDFSVLHTFSSEQYVGKRA